MAQEANKKEEAAGPLADIIGTEFIRRDGKETTFEERIKGNAVIAIYFSAHWCPVSLSTHKSCTHFIFKHFLLSHAVDSHQNWWNVTKNGRKTV